MTSALELRVGAVTVRRLAARAAELAATWNLHPFGTALSGGSWAYLLPCRDERDRRLVLKVSAAAPVVAREAAALDAWRERRAAVALVARAPDAILLRRVRPGTAFTGAEAGAEEAVAAMLAQLHEPTTTELRSFLPHAADLVPLLDRIRARLAGCAASARLAGALDEAVATIRSIERA